MPDSINLSWEWILGTSITLIIIVLGWIAKQLHDLKNDNEQRIRFLENENSSKNAKIELFEKIILRPFKEKNKNVR